jgi:O-antigen/teichoic acid export membrane protein
VLALLAVGVTVERALIVNALASVLGCAYFVTRLSPNRFRPALSEAGTILRMAGPIALFILGAQLLQNLDLWFLKWVGSGVGDDTVGHYVAATNLARLPGVAHFVMVAVLVPTVSRAGSVGDAETVTRLVRGAVRFLVLTLLPGCAFLAVRSEQLMELVFSGAYAEGALIQAILVVRYGLFGVLLMTFCSVLIALGDPRRAALQMLQLVPLGAVLAVLFIRARGAEGAALAALATILCGVVLSGLALRRRTGPLVDLGTVLRALVATAVLVAVLAPWSPAPPMILVEALVAVPAVATLLVVLGAVSKGELIALLRGPLSRR